MWCDLVEGQDTKTAPVASTVEILEIEDQAQAARYREVNAKLSQDIASMVQYNAAKDDSKRRSHVVNVMHEKAQLNVGKQLLNHK